MGRRIKVAMIGIKGIPASFGGFETAVHELSIRLVERNVDVVVYNRTNNIEYKDKFFEGVRLVRLPTFRSKNLSTIFHAFISSVHCCFTDCNVVHFYTTGTTLFAPLVRLFGKKTVCSVDGLDWQRKKWGRFASWYLRMSEYTATRWCHTIVSDAKVIEQYYLKEHGTASDVIAYGANIATSENPAYVNKWGLESGRYVLFVGRLVPENNVHHLIRAFENAETDMKLCIVGDDPWEHDYVDQLKSTEDPRIVFTGYVYGEGYRELGTNAGIFVLPDEVGGTHPALIEAMAFGSCVLVNGTAANCEVIGDAGFSYDGAQQEVDLQRKLQYLLDNPQVVGEYQRRAVERIRKHYQWDMVTDQHIKMYERILGVTKTSPPAERSGS